MATFAAEADMDDWAAATHATIVEDRNHRSGRSACSALAPRTVAGKAYATRAFSRRPSARATLRTVAKLGLPFSLSAL